MGMPDPYMLVNTIVLHEAKTSTEIENIFTTEDELYKAVSDTKSEEKAYLAVREILRYKEAIWSGYHAMNEAIFSQPYIKPITIGKVFGSSSRTTLSKCMKELVAGKILTPKKDGSEVYYLNEDLIRILSE